MRVAEQGITQRKFLGMTGNAWTLVMLGIGACSRRPTSYSRSTTPRSSTAPGVGGSQTIGGIAVSQQLLFSQKIFYFHVPVAIGSFLVFTFAAAYALLFLIRKDSKYDVRSRIGMEVTLLLVMLTLITGDIWTRFEWGVWWAFGEPRLTTYAIMALLVVAYFVLRAAVSDDERRATYGAVFCIIAWLDAPISFLITRLIPTSIHPVVLREWRWAHRLAAHGVSSWVCSGCSSLRGRSTSSGSARSSPRYASTRSRKPSRARTGEATWIPYSPRYTRRFWVRLPTCSLRTCCCGWGCSATSPSSWSRMNGLEKQIAVLEEAMSRR